jgi:aspartyl-tRNA(Asn)/glutamyl-tRNA(Gln) amidotransferase subunit C
MSSLTPQDVRKVARLARLAITDEQAEQYRASLAAVLTYMDRLRELNLDGVEPMAHPTDSTNRLRDDTPGPTLPTSAFMQIAPPGAAMPPFITVPKVIGEGGGA